MKLKFVKKIVWLFGISLFAAIILSTVPARSHTVTVPEGFAFGNPKSQQRMVSSGSYTVKRYGFPATYREVQSFSPADYSYAAVSFEQQGTSVVYVVVNIVFWLGLLAGLLAPITIFWRPAKKSNQVKSTEVKYESQVKNDANTRD